LLTAPMPDLPQQIRLVTIGAVGMAACFECLVG